MGQQKIAKERTSHARVALGISDTNRSSSPARISAFGKAAMLEEADKREQDDQMAGEGDLGSHEKSLCVCGGDLHSLGEPDDNIAAQSVEKFLPKGPETQRN